MKEFFLDFSPTDHKTHRNFQFTLESNQKRLFMTLEYAPKFINDRDLFNRMIDKEALHLSPREREKLKGQSAADGRKLSNLLTFTLIGPGGIAGCAHRSSCRQVIEIGEDYATPGFFPVRPVPGEWILRISASSLYGKTQLKITMGEESRE